MANLYSYQQILNFTPEQLKADPNLLDVINNIYTGGRADIKQHLLADPNFQETVRKQLQKVGLSGFAISADAVQRAERATQAGQTIDPKSAQEIEEAKNIYKNLGIDFNSVPIFSQIQTGKVPETFGGQVVESAKVGGPTSVSGGQTGSQLFKVPTNAIGPDGKPIYDVFIGTEHITSPDDPRLKGVNIANLPTGQAPSGFTSQFGGAGGTSTTTSGVFDPAKFGITPDMWNKLDAGTKAYVESVAKTVQGQYDQGLVKVSVNADLLNKAMLAAQSDPEIIAKYGDSLKLAQGDIQKNLSLIGAEYGQSMTITQQRQEADRKALLEQQAANGQVYSGFAQQAKSRLQSEQSGVIESSKRTLQGQLNDFGRILERKYGTAGLTQFSPLNVDGISYNPYGNITGTADFEKKNDIYNKGLQEYNAIKL